jgi:serine/threonine-protein kinase
MGSVWRGEHLELRAPIAVKLMDPDIASNDEMRQRFLREARATAALRSPHVVQILDYGVDGSDAFIIMELLEGESLAQRLQRLGVLSPRATARVILEVSRAIGRAHVAGIVHRDLKPANVFIVQNDDDEIAKVLDFGIAKNLRAKDSLRAGATQTGTMLGTPYYMSPEQAHGSIEVGPETDIWALGVIAFECIVGSRPFDGISLPSLVLAICAHPMPVPSSRSKVPEGFDSWFARACSRDRGHRFGSAKAAARSLATICGMTAEQFEQEDEEVTKVWDPRLVPTMPKALNEGLATTARASTSSNDTKRVSAYALPRHMWVALGALVLGLGAWSMLIRSRASRAPEPTVAIEAPEPTYSLTMPLAPLPLASDAAIHDQIQPRSKAAPVEEQPREVTEERLREPAAGAPAKTTAARTSPPKARAPKPPVSQTKLSKKRVDLGI